MLLMRNALPHPDPLGHDGFDDLPRISPRAAAAEPAVRAPEKPSPLINAAEYERWLLPEEPRQGVEKLVHWLSLSAGVVALTSGLALTWLVL